MVIANGKLLFKQNCEKGEMDLKYERCIWPPQRETEYYQESSPFNTQPATEHSFALARKNRVCGQVSQSDRPYTGDFICYLNDNRPQVITEGDAGTVHMYKCALAHACGSQRTSLGIVPQCLSLAWKWPSRLGWLDSSA